MVLATFYATALLLALPWAALAVLAFWVWRRAKSGGHLVMLVGAGWLTLDAVLRTLDVYLLGAESGYWGQFIGATLIASGFGVTVQPLVAADIAKILGRRGALPTPPTSAPPPHGAVRP